MMMPQFLKLGDYEKNDMLVLDLMINMKKRARMNGDRFVLIVLIFIYCMNKYGIKLHWILL